MINQEEYKYINLDEDDRAYESIKNLFVDVDKIFDIEGSCIVAYEDEHYYVEYFDIFFAGYDTSTMKMERTVYNKKTKECSCWRAWHKHPQKFIDEFNLGKDRELNFPSSNEEMNQKLNRWILEKLAQEEKWCHL